MVSAYRYLEKSSLNLDLRLFYVFNLPASRFPSSPAAYILGSWVVKNIRILYKDRGAVTYCIGNWAVRDSERFRIEGCPGESMASKTGALRAVSVLDRKGGPAGQQRSGKTRHHAYVALPHRSSELESRPSGTRRTGRVPNCAYNFGSAFENNSPRHVRRFHVQEHGNSAFSC